MYTPNWKQILSDLDVGVVVQERDHRISFANTQATAILGITAGEIEERTTDDQRWDVISPDGVRVTEDGHPGPRCLRTGAPVRGVILGVRRGDSTERVWILASAVPDRGASGEVERVIITFSDISIAQRAMREQEATYQSVFRSMSEGLVIHAPDGSIRTANEAAERALGLTVEQMTGRAATDPRWRLVKPDGSPVDASYIPSETALRTGRRVGETIIGVHRPTGEAAWLAVRADPLREAGDETLRGVVATFMDVTEERTTKLALEASRAQIQRVLDAVPGVVYQYLRSADGTDRFPFVAGRIHEVLGLDPAEVRRDPHQMFSLIAEADRRSLLAHLAVTVSERREFDYEVSYEEARGTRWLRVHGIPEQTAEGLLYTGVVLDVTEPHRMADALRRRQRREAMGDIAAGVAHNFNNLLAVILPNIEMALEQATPEASRHLGDATRAAENAVDLVRRMLTLGRSEPHETEATVDLLPVVREVIHICRQTFDRGIAISEDLLVTGALVRGRASTMQQIILNLCLNARDALEGAPGRALRVRLQRDGDDAVLLQIRDTGHGMSQETLRRIGEPFFTTKGPGGGTGLGLASAFHTITEAGGTWHIESVVGEGTTFAIRLPTVATVPVRAPDAPADRAAPLAGVALIVDDEPMVRATLARQVARTGLRAETAESAAAAFDVIRHGRISDLRVILLDLSMPGMSGAEALPHLRALAPGVPIIVLSGHVPEQIPGDAAAHVLQKPLAQRDLVAALRSVLQPDPASLG